MNTTKIFPIFVRYRTMHKSINVKSLNHVEGPENLVGDIFQTYSSLQDIWYLNIRLLMFSVNDDIDNLSIWRKLVFFCMREK